MSVPARSKARPVHRIGLPPVIGERPKVLVLGTIPSVRSIERNEYYGNPRNHFWKLVHALFEAEPDDRYEERVRFITERRIALWDVLAECDIRGSKDHSIANPVPNDIEGMFRRYTDIDHIFLNGKMAGHLYAQLINDRWPEGRPRPVAYVLPSSSTANAIRFEEKLDAWRIVRRASLDWTPKDIS